MLELAWPWALALLPLPLLIRRLAPAAPAPQAALRVPFGDELDTELPGASRPAPWRLWLAALAWILLVAAVARPEWLGEPLELPVAGRDLMLAVDLSESMGIEDFVIGDQAVDRITATKSIAGEFLDRRKGDRVGLILFGDQPFLQAPLTFDRATVRQLLHEAVIGLAGKRTSIGDAIGLAVKRLKDQDVKSRVLILLTDGANTAGQLEPLQAAEVAGRVGLRIHTVGIGADRMIMNTFFGRQVVNPSQDLDEATLKAIAEKTGGRYFRARDTKELESIYEELDRLEPVTGDPEVFRPVAPLFFWPLGTALMIAFLLGAGGLRRHRAGFPNGA